MSNVLGPPARPCGSCPYRIDVPSGVWADEEYAKLPEYDGETGHQKPSVFLCHLQDHRLCAGWAGCHDMEHNLGLRIALLTDTITQDVYEATLDYASPVDLWATGAEAATHGRAEIHRPGRRAQHIMGKLRQYQDRGR